MAGSRALVDIVYDGGCEFCRRALAVMRWLAHREIFWLHDASDRAALTERFPMLARADLDDAMFAIDADAGLTRGFFAFRRLIWESPWLYPLLLVFYCPGVSILGPAIYAWVARHRRRLGCAGGACDVVRPGSLGRR